MTLRNLLASSRFLMIIAVIGSFLAAVASIVYGGLRTVAVVLQLFQKGLSDKVAKGMMVSFIELIDLFLVSAIFYIISLGLYELFIDDQIQLPDWLVIHTLDDLKSKLINGMVVILAVYFLGVLANWDGQKDLLSLSAAISMIILALTVFQFVKARQDH